MGVHRLPGRPARWRIGAVTGDAAGTGPLERLAEGLERMTGRAHRVDGSEVVGPGRPRW